MPRTLVAAMAALLVLSACGEGQAGSPPTSATSASASSSASTSVPGSAATSSGPASTTPEPATRTASPKARAPSATRALSPAPAAFAYVPLWPFASAAEARQWQEGQRNSPPRQQQRWRLDPGKVAVAFARQYLRFTEIDRVIRRTVTANDARVTVGWKVEGTTGTAAVIHLVRIGAGAARPWEVVGTDDTADFSLTRPRYGSTVAGSIIAGGHIRGVDESIRVTARQLSPGVVGAYCCRSAGQAAPWSAPLRLTGTRPGSITIVASTGGHLTTVERFTITGVRSK